jgi:hypothetical protein
MIQAGMGMGNSETLGKGIIYLCDSWVKMQKLTG